MIIDNDWSKLVIMPATRFIIKANKPIPLDRAFREIRPSFQARRLLSIFICQIIANGEYHARP